MNPGHSKKQNRQSESLIDYDGMVYCIEVPSHIFYTRLNLKPCWTGNSNRHGQKGTLGIALQQKDMPFTSDGLVPDLIMNPHCLPSRMTVGQLVEMTAAKIGSIKGHFIDGTPYCDYDVRKLPDMLGKLGFNKYGNEVLYCGMTGKKIEAEIFMAPSYQIRLKHMTADKYHSRSRGPRQALTRQPLEGRSRDGGLKIGKPSCLRVDAQASG
jgi:DNA-directed RNA polymerase II subunit RPB2